MNIIYTAHICLRFAFAFCGIAVQDRRVRANAVTDCGSIVVVVGTPVTPSQRSVSGSDRSLAKSQTRESPAQFSPYSEVTFRNKSSPFTRLKRDYNRTPSESSDTDKTKPKLKIQSFEVSGMFNIRA